MEWTIPGNAEVIQLADQPTRAFECHDLKTGAVAVVLVGDPVKPPRHYTHDLSAVRWYRLQKRKRPNGQETV